MPPFHPSSGPTKRRRIRRLFLILLLLLILFTTGLVYFHQSLLQSMARSLVYVSELQPSDVIVVLSGGRTERMEKAIELWEKGYAPIIQMTLPRELEPTVPDYDGQCREIRTYQGLIELRQVAPEQVLWSSSPYYSTYDEGLFLKDRMQAQKWDSAIIVPGYFQSRRAKWVFDNVFNDSGIQISIFPAPPDIYSATDWWTHEEGFITVENEWMKSLYYRVKSWVGKP